MSITYNLYLETSLTPSEFISELGKSLGTELKTEPLNQALLTADLACLDASFSRVQTPTKDFIAEDFGFLPQLSLSLRLHKAKPGDLDTAQGTVVKILTALLKHLDSDLLLLREHESVAFRRQGLVLEHNPEDPLWLNPQRLQQVLRK